MDKNSNFSFDSVDFESGPYTSDADVSALATEQGTETELRCERIFKDGSRCPASDRDHFAWTRYGGRLCLLCNYSTVTGSYSVTPINDSKYASKLSVLVCKPADHRQAAAAAVPASVSVAVVTTDVETKNSNSVAKEEAPLKLKVERCPICVGRKACQSCIERGLRKPCKRQKAATETAVRVEVKLAYKPNARPNIARTHKLVAKTMSMFAQQPDFDIVSKYFEQGIATNMTETPLKRLVPGQRVPKPRKPTAAVVSGGKGASTSSAPSAPTPAMATAVSSDGVLQMGDSDYIIRAVESHDETTSSQEIATDATIVLGGTSLESIPIKLVVSKKRGCKSLIKRMRVKTMQEHVIKAEVVRSDHAIEARVLSPEEIEAVNNDPTICVHEIPVSAYIRELQALDTIDQEYQRQKSARRAASRTRYRNKVDQGKKRPSHDSSDQERADGMPESRALSEVKLIRAPTNDAATAAAATAADTTAVATAAETSVKDGGKETKKPRGRGTSKTLKAEADENKRSGSKRAQGTSKRTSKKARGEQAGDSQEIKTDGAKVTKRIDELIDTNAELLYTYLNDYIANGIDDDGMMRTAIPRAVLDSAIRLVRDFFRDTSAGSNNRLLMRITLLFYVALIRHGYCVLPMDYLQVAVGAFDESPILKAKITYQDCISEWMSKTCLFVLDVKRSGGPALSVDTIRRLSWALVVHLVYSDNNIGHLAESDAQGTDGGDRRSRRSDDESSGDESHSSESDDSGAENRRRARRRVQKERRKRLERRNLDRAIAQMAECRYWFDVLSKETTVFQRMHEGVTSKHRDKVRGNASRAAEVQVESKAAAAVRKQNIFFFTRPWTVPAALIVDLASQSKRVKFRSLKLMLQRCYVKKHSCDSEIRGSKIKQMLIERKISKVPKSQQSDDDDDDVDYNNDAGAVDSDDSDKLRSRKRTTRKRKRTERKDAEDDTRDSGDDEKMEQRDSSDSENERPKKRYKPSPAGHAATKPLDVDD